MSNPILLFGRYPPPIGGNSQHLANLRQRLLTIGRAVTVIDPKPPPTGTHDDPAGVVRLTGNPWSRYRELRRLARQTSSDTIVHLHVSTFRRFKWFARLFFQLYASRRKVVTIHSGSFNALTEGVLTRSWVAKILRQFDWVVAVGDHLRPRLETLGVPPGRLSIIPAFLPLAAKPIHLPHELTVTTKQLVVTSGMVTSLYDYEPMIRLAQNQPDDSRRYIFCFYGGVTPEARHQIVEKLQACSNVTVYHDLTTEEFQAVLARADLYIRSTRRDGDSVAVREALHHGTPVIATDCVPRPHDCTPWKLGDVDQLHQLLEDPATYQPPPPQSDPFDQLLDLYDRLSTAG